MNRKSLRYSLVFVAVASAAAQTPTQCQRLITANIAALEQPIYFNRLGAMLPQGEIYALASDIVPVANGALPSATGPSCADSGANCKAGQVALRPDKRPRPMVLRANVGDCLQINFTNYIESNPSTPLQPGQTNTRNAGIHLTGMELVNNISSDSSNVGRNSNSLAAAAPSGQTPVAQHYTYYAKAEGNFLLYSFDDGDPGQWASGLFGAVNVQPPDAEWYRSQVTHQDLQNATYSADHLPSNMTLKQVLDASQQPVKVDVNGVPQDLFILTTVQEVPAADRHTTTTARVFVCGATGAGGCLPRGIYTLSGHPLVNYDAADSKKPILSLLNPVHVPRRQPGSSTVPTGEIVHTDLTAIITGPFADRFPYNQNNAAFHNNPALPDRRQPYREFSIFYHVNNQIVQAFPEYYPNPNTAANIARTLGNGNDTFGINYGTGGIGSEILANRLGIGPEKDCVECKFEEFFLSSWAVGDPAMVVTPDKIAKYPDDPSNVYHSYLKDHVKFRIFNASPTQQHVHHQHAHQWLHTANDDESTYLDSQMIIPGAAYTLDMVYNGSGNRNGTIGDSIFHCHFYPHFAAGMWSLWRVHDVFESGTIMAAPSAPGQPSLPLKCDPTDAACWNRALPDGEISAGSPIPALVPLPTLGMAPLPANVKLVDQGKRTLVQPETTSMATPGTMKFSDPNETLNVKNPGYPFFVPGLAGHRAPHPPLDFAWKVDANGQPVLDAKGNRIPLDGGLPRHLILTGQYVSEFHTGYDFSKDFTAPTGGGPGAKFVGTMTATQLPENGTAVERAAMASQSQRTVATYTPDGLPGNFTKDGLPPAPGAPFARPEVDDNGNNVNNVRVYRAAVVQRDVVLNKEGWHYPQQRFLTLWNDVDHTMDGSRPPQPLFFRANTGETVEFWHTNLVPSYYDLDDFQVRTPTDVIGEHIHLVKFDVLASDGAANGFNYEDGTFSPDEVRERITTIDNTGTTNKGLYNYNPSCWSSPSPLLTCVQSTPQTNLTPLTVAQSGYPFTDSSGQWTGAQTTIQRWDTDPLLDNNGRDRTMRTVFTHDHFGPSTHQQIGLYAGLVIEPDNSQWFDSQTGERMYSRPDGGPTNWAAMIHTANPADSYREFMLEYQDSQLAYSRLSLGAKQPPPSPVTTFSIGNSTSILNTFNTCMQSAFPASWSNGCPLGRPNSTFDTSTCGASDPGHPACCVFRTNFCSNGIALTQQATISGSSPNWTISDHGGADTYKVSGATSQNVSVNNVPPAWYDTAHAINPEPPGANLVNIISGIDSSATPGTYSVNYRNDPVALRVTQPGSNESQPRTQASGNPGDLSYAFTSITRADSALNVQPDNGGANGSSGKFPGCPLSPTQLPGGTDAACSDPTVKQWASDCASNGTCVQPTDPYTPTLRAFEGDNVQIRTLAGAHVRTHPLTLRGLKWLSEPSATNSGYRATQPTGLSEHFELLFRVPYSNSLSSTTNAADYLYHASSSLTGTANGTWGILRAYDPSKPVIGLQKLPVQSVLESHTPPAACPANATPIHYNVIATDGKNLPNNAVTFNTRPIAGNIFDAGGSPTFTFTGNNANTHPVIYVLEENLQKVSSGALPAEPLILRAKAGDCISVTLKNALPSRLLGDPGIITRTNPSPFWLAPFGASNGFNGQPAAPGPNGPLFPGLNLSTSMAAGLNPQLVTYDITRNAGFNIGFNPDQLTQPPPSQPNPGVAPDCTASKASCKTYTWYAGNLSVRDNKTLGVPIELGSANLLPSDPLLQEPLGLYGALIVEPPDSKWTEDTGTKSSATVTRTITELDGASRQESFREFVVLAQDDAAVNKTLIVTPSSSSSAAAKPGRAMGKGSRGSEASNQVTSNLRFAPASPNGTNVTANIVNYRTESVDARYQTSGTFMDLTNFYSNSQVGNKDPQTPVFTAAAGDQVRFRMLRAGQDDDIVMTVHGHAWQEQPFVHGSREIGFNPLSNWFGTQQLSGNDKLELLIGEAGGRFHVPGDYLYNGVLQSVNPQNLGGMWGILRVTADSVQAAKVQYSGDGVLALAGNVTRAANGERATQVAIYLMPGERKLGEAAVAADGSWSFAQSVNLPEGAAIRIVSNLPLWPGEVTVHVGGRIDN